MKRKRCTMCDRRFQLYDQYANLHFEKIIFYTLGLTSIVTLQPQSEETATSIDIVRDLEYNIVIF